MFIIIGNLVSFFAALFMLSSCVVKQRHHIFQLQFIQCMLLAISSYFFNAYAGIIANVISGIRNILVAKGLFSKQVMCLFLLISVVLGIYVNNKGLIGLMPIFANIQFALCCYVFTGMKETKICIWVNVLIWIIYSFLILDYVTAISDSLVLVVNSITIFRIHQKEKIVVLFN